MGASYHGHDPKAAGESSQVYHQFLTEDRASRDQRVEIKLYATLKVVAEVRAVALAVAPAVATSVGDPTGSHFRWSVPFSAE